jgi:hypothetical protein
VQEKGMAQLPYRSNLLRTKPNAGDLETAIQAAKLDALQRFVARFSQAKRLEYEKIRSLIEEQLDQYVQLDFIIDQTIDKQTKQLNLVAQVSIDALAIEVALQKESSVQQTRASERSTLAFVFVARREMERKQFDARVATRTVQDNVETQTETATATGETLSFEGRSETDQIHTTGGSTTRKADTVSYEVSTSQEVSVAMNDIFATAGYEVVDGEWLYDETGGLVDTNRFKADFGTGDDISGETKRDAVKGCRDLGIHYFAMGTLDIGIAETDSVSGLRRVFVRATGKILQLDARFPKTIASVGPVQYSGLGSDQKVAEINALKLASQKAAEELVAQLRAKNIK